MTTLEKPTPAKLDYQAIDVDNHYYEPVDAFTRYQPKEFRSRGVQMVQDGKRTLAVFGGVVNHFIPNPTFDPIIEPGCLDLLFRGEIPEGVNPASLMKVDSLADHPEYQNRDARLKILDKQNLQSVFMLPTFACGVEEGLKHDVEATMVAMHAFNQWLDEDWGFDRPDGRFVSAPIISLADPEKAVEALRATSKALDVRREVWSGRIEKSAEATNRVTLAQGQSGSFGYVAPSLPPPGAFPPPPVAGRLIEAAYRGFAENLPEAP